MHETPPRRIPLSPAADAFFTRQTNAYTGCGPAALATVAQLYGRPPSLSYGFFMAALDPRLPDGVSNANMIMQSERYLPFMKAGEGVYHGGVAIANIMLEEDGREEGHFVVFLCREHGSILYYDPYDHALVINREDKIRWVSETDRLQNWAINFPPLPGYDAMKPWLAAAAVQNDNSIAYLPDPPRALRAAGM